MLHSIQAKIEAQIPISTEDAVYLYEKANAEELKSLASKVKSRFHPVDSATYLIMAIVNYTNICVAKCVYCSFYRLPHDKEGYLLSLDQVCDKIEALLQLGGRLVGFNGGFHPKLRIHDYAELFKGVRQRYPKLEFYEMTVAEFMFSCKVSKVTYDEGAQILKDSGTRWVTGGGAEILSNSFRKRHSPGKYTVEDYYNAQEEIVRAGLGSTATMVIGFDETMEERFDHLESLRKFQDRVGGKLASLLCWTYKPFNNEFGGVEISNEEYLRWLAICRIYLHNFKNIRTSVLTKNAAALDGLSYGANDFDLPTEDEVTQKAGATISHEFEKILGYAKSEGFNVSMREPWRVN